MTLPFWVLLIPYGCYSAIFIAFALVDCYHMAKFGTFGVVNFLALLLFLGGTFAIFSVTASLLATVDWSQPLIGGIATDLLTEPPSI